MMIEEYDFLSKAELPSLVSEVQGLDSFHSALTPNIYILGAPYYAKKQLGKNSAKTLLHNQVMEENFPSLLAKTKAFFENYLKDTVHLLPNISFPGFHIINVAPLQKTVANFHRDSDLQFVKEDLGKELEEEEQITFTIQLSQDENLISGLLYFKDSTFDKKLFVGERNYQTHDFISGFAELQTYRPGKIYIHRNLTHSLFAENKSNTEISRVTFQGSLLKLKSGWLLFW